MDAKELKTLAIELMDAVRQRDLGEFELSTDDFSVRIKAKEAPVIAAAAIPAAAPVVAPASDAAQPAPTAPAEEPISGTPVEAPLVGIFYSAPAPEEPPFIEVGQEVKKGDTLFIIEAMKTMNEIAAPCDGKISRILAQSGDMVEYKQTLVVIE